MQSGAFVVTQGMDTPCPDPADEMLHVARGAIDGDSRKVSKNLRKRDEERPEPHSAFMKAPCPDPAEEMLHVARGAVADFISCHPHHFQHRDDLHGEAYLALVTVLRQRPHASEGYVFISVKHALEEYARNIPAFSVPRSTIARCEREGRDVPELPREASNDALRNVESEDEFTVVRTEELEACCRDETDSTIVDLKEQGYTVEEIGLELGITKGAVSKRWRKVTTRYRIRETN